MTPGQNTTFPKHAQTIWNDWCITIADELFYKNPSSHRPNVVCLILSNSFRFSGQMFSFINNNQASYRCEENFRALTPRHSKGPSRKFPPETTDWSDVQNFSSREKLKSKRSQSTFLECVPDWQCDNQGKLFKVFLFSPCQPMPAWLCFLCQLFLEILLARLSGRSCMQSIQLSKVRAPCGKLNPCYLCFAIALFKCLKFYRDCFFVLLFLR